MSEGVEPSRVGEVPRIVAGSPAALGGEASGDANALLPPVLESVPSLGLLAPRGGPRRGSSLSSVDVPQNDERSRRGSTTLRRLVIDHPEEIPVRYKRTKRPYVKGKRSLTNRIRQLRDEEHELKCAQPTAHHGNLPAQPAQRRASGACVPGAYRKRARCPCATSPCLRAGCTRCSSRAACRTWA